MNKTPPDPIRRARALARLWLRRGLRPFVTNRLDGTPGTFRVWTRGGSRLELFIAEPGDTYSAVRERGDLDTGSEIDDRLSPIYRWDIVVGKPAALGVSLRDSPTHAIVLAEVLHIAARSSHCDQCKRPLLFGWCWRRRLMKGHWWVHESHWSGKPVHRRARVRLALEPIAGKFGL